MIFSCAEWIPQIIKTCKCKSCGSFSILGLSIQTPGQAISLFVLIGTKTEWYVWITTSVSLLLHVILLSFLLYYHFCYKGVKQKVTSKQAQDEIESEQMLIYPQRDAIQ